MSNKDNLSHLTPSELDYELKIRCVFGLTTNRQKINALRDILIREEDGTEIAPKDSSKFNEPEEELKACSYIYEDILSKINLAWNSNDNLNISYAKTRLEFLQNRLERIHPSTQAEQTVTFELLDVVYDAIYKLENERLPSTSSNNKSVVNRSGSIRSNQNTSAENISHLQSNLNESVNNEQLIDVEGAVGFTDTNQRNLGFQNRYNNVPFYDEVNDIARELGQLNVDKSKNNNRVNFKNTNQHAFNRQQQKNCNNPLSTQLDNRYELRYSDNNSNRLPSTIPNNNVNTLQHTQFSNFNRTNNNVNQVENNNRFYTNCLNSNSMPNNLNQFVDNNQFQFPRSSVYNDANQFVENNEFQFPRLNTNRVYNNFNRCSENNQINFPRSMPEYQPIQPRRRSVPVNSWGINFSGDSKGLQLHEFLSQVKVYQRSEGISSNELLYSVIHLLSGRAKLWYLSNHEKFNSWSEFELAIKQEFLPENYEYMLFSEISNRVQKGYETFAEYMTHMQAAFNCISVPLSEQFKLFIVMKNLLPKYSDAIAPFDIRSLAELSIICRRIDSAKVRQQQMMPFQSNSYDRQQRRFVPNREVNLIENDNLAMETNDCIDADCEPNELCAINADRQRFNNRSTNSLDPQSQTQSNVLRVMCWNCRRIGNHMFRECKSVRTIFCYRCGKQNMTTRTCTCPKNEIRNLTSQGTSQPSANSPIPNPQN